MRIGLRFSPILLVIAGIVLSTFSPRLASADWPEFGRAISTAPLGQVHSDIATDGLGGAIITWQDGRSPRVNIFAQHVLSSGEIDAAWPTDGRALLADAVAIASAAGGQSAPVIVPDGAGGAVVAWQDLRSEVNDFDIFAQHVLASGVVDPAWPANGRALVEIQGQQKTEAIASDGAGGAIVTWMDTRPGASVADIYAQHVLASGVVDSRWPANGVAVSAAAGLQDLPAIVADGAGGSIIAWHDARSATTGFDIYAQHVLSSGVVDPAWPLDGRALCTAGGDQGNPTISTDAASGAVVAWTDSRIVGSAHIFAQHVLASGAVDPLWPANGREISGAAVSEVRPRAVPDGLGGAIVTWQGFTVHVNMYAQHVTATGVVDPAWPAGGRALSDADRDQVHAAIASDGAGGAIVAWEDNFDVVAHHVLASGALDPTFPRALSNLSSSAGDPGIVATGGGGAIVSWTDGRNGATSSADIFALQVLVAGTTDVPAPSEPGISFARPSPNPARAAFTLRFALPRAARVRLAIYDADGRRLRELASGAQPAGEHVIGWDLRDESGHVVGAGLYFARLEADGRSFTQKLARLQ